MTAPVPAVVVDEVDVPDDDLFADMPDVPEVHDDSVTPVGTPEPPELPPVVVAVKTGPVARVLNAIKAVIAFVGTALAGVVVLLPEGTYKGYVLAGIAAATALGTYLAKNQPLIERLGGEALDAYQGVVTVIKARSTPGRHQAKAPADQLSIGPDSIV